MGWSRLLLLVAVTLWTAAASAAAVQGDAAAAAAAAVSERRGSTHTWGPAMRSLPEALLGRTASGTAVEVQVSAPGVGPSILNSKESLGTVLSLPAAPSATALVGHDAPSGSGTGTASSTKPLLPYITPLGYSDTDNGGGLADLAEAMGLPNERDGLKLSRWVICSWVVANISAVDAVRNRNSVGVFLERIPQLLRSVQDLAPSQVYAVAAANITMGFTFTGVEADSLSPAATAAVKQTASQMAGGYSPQLITVSTTPPAALTAGSQVDLQAAVQDAPAGPPTVVKRGKDLGGPAAAAAPAPAGRRLQQQHRLHAGGAAVPSQLVAAFLDGDSSLQQLPEAALTLSLPRRFLQAATGTTAVKAATAAKASKAAGPLAVWLLYKHVAPANTTALLMELCSSCNVTPSVAVGFDFAPQPCGQDLQAALKSAGVKVDDDSYSQLLTVPPTVSLSVRLAVGMTAAQVAAGTDVALARWLAEPATAQAVARMYTPDAVIRWLHTPEIWYDKKAGQSSGLSPGAAAGIAVGCTAAVSAAVALAAWLIHRRKQQGAAAADDKTDGTDSQSSGRRRRRQGKRRYLLPDPPQADSQSTQGAGGAGPSGLAASAGSAAVNGGEDGDGSAHEDDAEMTPDQIRPHLRSLGDSVTSAVRFEQSDEEEEAAAAATEAADTAEGAADTGAAAAAAGPSGAAVAGAAVAAAAGAAARGSAAAGPSSSSAAAASSWSVLEARAALVAEYRLSNQGQSQAAAAAAAAASGSGGRLLSAGSSLADPSVPAAVSPELAAAAEICSAVSTPNHSLSPAGTLAGGGVEMTQRRLKPVDERAAAASAAAVAAAASLPQAGAVAPPTRRKTPFAAGSYNFEGLADPAPPAAATATAAGAAATDDSAAVPACPAAAMAAASAKAVVLPPRRLPLSPGNSGSSSLSSDAAAAAAAAAANAGLVASPRSPAPRLSSSGGSSTQQQAANGTAAALGRRSSSGSACSLPSPSPSGSQGVGLQQLVSVASPAGSPASDTAGSSLAFAANTPLPRAASNGSMCSSVLQAATESGDSSGLQFSSSLSGPVLHSDSATTLSPTASRWSTHNGVHVPGTTVKLQGATAAAAAAAAGAAAAGEPAAVK